MIREDVVLEPVPERLGLRDWWVRASRMLLASLIRWRRRRVLALPMIVVGLSLAGAAVRFTDRTSCGFTLLFLLPILAGAYFYGAAGGTLTGLAGASAAALEPFGGQGSQLFDNDVLRFAMFVLVGSLTGAFVSAFARELERRKRLLGEAARSLWRALEVHNHERAAHAERVAGYAQAIARELQLPAEQVERTRDAALLHNIGHLAVPQHSSLTPLVSARVLQEAREFGPLLPIIRSHHERFDGTGYPDRLHSHEIPLEARIVTAANAYDNLTNIEGDQTALDPVQALAHIRSEAGSRFDPAVVAALEALFARWRIILPPDFFLTSHASAKSPNSARQPHLQPPRD